MVMKKSGRGSIGRSERRRERYENDEEYRNRKKEIHKIWGKKNKKRCREKLRERVRILSEFKNKRCKKCNKLLEYRTKGDYCRKHCNVGRKKKEKK